MFSGGTSTPIASSKRPHTRASAAARRSQSRAGSLAPSASTPVPDRTRRATAGGKSSGLAGRALTASYAGSEIGAEQQQEDVEGLQSQGVLLKTESHAVSVLGVGLPAETQQVLNGSDFYTDPYAALLDHDNGYACLAGRERCYVWSLAQTSSTSSPTCYIFPIPSSPSSSLSLAATIFSPVPFVAFVSQGGSGREPGFLLVGTTGAIRYWSSISQALSDVERCSSSSLQLTQGELVRAMHHLAPNHYVIATSGARLFSLTLSQSLSSGGVQIQTALLSRSRGMLARVGGLFGGATADPRAGILAMASSSASSSSGRGRAHESGTVLFAAQDRALQAWKLSEGAEQFIGDADIYEALRDAIYDSFAVPESPNSSLQPEIIDLAAFSSSQALLLVAFPSIRKQQKSSRATRTEYALVTVSGSFAIDNVRLLSYSHEPKPTPLSAPRLHISRNTGNLAFVVFPEAVCLIGLQTDSFEEEIALRNPIKDRLLGAGCKSAYNLTLLAASSGLLQLEVNKAYLETEQRRTANRIKDNENPEAAATRRLKNKLDQAVIFGDRSSNPLAFELRVDSTGDLVQAAEAVSKEILGSSSPHLPNIIDLRAQLSDRIARLRHLIVFIQDNSLISRLSRTSKRHLTWDAEKLNAASSLWSIQNARIALQADNQDNLLTEAIETLNLDTQAEADSTRAFYRYSADSLPYALEQLLPILRRHLTVPNASLEARSDAVYQVAQTLCSTYKTVLRFRKESANVYGITDGDQTCLSEPWSSRTQLLGLMRASIEALESIIDARTREMGSNIDNETDLEYGQSGNTAKGSREREEREKQKNLRDFTAELADYALAMHEERMAYLQSLSDNASAITELRSLLDIYVSLRSRSISLLARLGRPNVAYDLAERYRDFKSLVLLCNDPQIGSNVRVGFYIEKYKQDFGFALYQYYLETGRLHDLLIQDRMYEDMLSSFLEQSNVPRLSWVQNVATLRFGDASTALLEEAARETQLAEQKLMLSLGKLAKAATLTREQLSSDDAAVRELEDVDDRLDIVATHDRIIELCRVTLDARDLAKPVQMQAEACVKRLCGNQRETMQNLATALFQGLLVGRALSPEDLVDLLTLKDNEAQEQMSDYSHAIELLTRDKRTPQARLQLSLRSLWRRTLLHDDWAVLRQSASTSSDENLAQALRNTALFTTLLACSTGEIDQSLLLRPAQALFSSSSEEEDAIRARFSSSDVYDGVQLDVVVQEYQRDSEKLRGWIEDKKIRLEQFYDEVERLVNLEVQRGVGEGQGDETAMFDDSIAQ